MTLRTHWIAWMLLPNLACGGAAYAAEPPPITIRTEAYPRPPYSQATYYVYERNGEVICTKLAVCDKYDHCSAVYRAGAFVDRLDQKTGKPAHETAAVLIPTDKRAKHQCLAKFVPDAL